MNSDRFGISSVEVISPYGFGNELLWDGVKAGRSSLLPDQSGIVLGRISDHCKADATKFFNASSIFETISTKTPGFVTLDAHALLYYSLQKVLEAAGWNEFDEDTGLIFATTTGQMNALELGLIQYLQSKVSAADFAPMFRYQTLNMALMQILSAISFRGPTNLVATACAASGQATLLAMDWLRLKKVKRCIVGTCELLCNLTIEGFKSFNLLSDEEARPFSSMCRGINLSEACVFLTLESESDANQKLLAYVLGGGTGVDAYHLTAPEPDGKGCRVAMTQALMDSNLNLNQIDWIHAHGTGSQHNDQAESRAIQSVFGANRVPVTSTKGLHGHALAASGLLEIGLDCLALRDQLIPATHNCNPQDFELKVTVFEENRSASLNYLLNNTLGFGGINCSIVLGRVL